MLTCDMVRRKKLDVCLYDVFREVILLRYIFSHKIFQISFIAPDVQLRFNFAFVPREHIFGMQLLI